MKVPRHNCRFSARRARAGRLSAGCNSKAHRYIAPCFSFCGGVAEWLKALAWKACIRETVSWVRIPLPPPRHASLEVRVLPDPPHPPRRLVRVMRLEVRA